MNTCLVCGKEYDGTNTCPVCGFRTMFSVGSLSEEQKKNMQEMVVNYRKGIYNDTKVYIRGYHFEEESGELVEKFHQDILLAQELYQMEANAESWSNIVFDKQPAGETVDLTVVVEGQNKAEHVVTVVAPKTEGPAWKVGLVIKPGLEGCIRVGNEKTYADSQTFSLKG